MNSLTVSAVSHPSPEGSKPLVSLPGAVELFKKALRIRLPCRADQTDGDL